MKKVFKKLLLTAVTVFTFSNVNAQALNEGDVVVDSYVGYSLIGSLFNTYELDGSNSSKTSGILPVGLRGEYMLTQRFGIGLDFFYTSNKLEETFANFDGSFYTNTTQRTKFASYITMNWHLAQRSDKFDFVLTSGIGYKNTNWSQKTTNEFNSTLDTEFSNVLPVSFRIGTTARYFFTDNIGANLTFSIGGPLVSAGISARF